MQRGTRFETIALLWDLDMINNWFKPMLANYVENFDYEHA
jgi:hypothetical protein